MRSMPDVIFLGLVLFMLIYGLLRACEPMIVVSACLTAPVWKECNP